MPSSKPIPTDRSQPPAPNEIEISIMGPGVGECLVLHLGGGRWAIVDSCIDPATKRPAALVYLEEMGLRPRDCVDRLVISHWHDDHIRGAFDVYQAAETAKVVFSSALRIQEFRELVGAHDVSMAKTSGLEEMANILQSLSERLRGRTASKGPVWASESKCIYRSDACRLHALSPSDANLTLTFRELHGRLLVEKAAKRNLVCQQPNDVAVVLWVDFEGGFKALLGSDLEVTRDDRTGWSAIVTSETRPSGSADVFKVPHHGSETGHDDRIWSQLLAANPVSVVVPYLAGKKPLPTEVDLQRLASHSDEIYIAGPMRGAKATLPSKRALKFVKMFAPDIRNTLGKLGHVRLRAAPGKPIAVEVFGSARQLAASA